MHVANVCRRRCPEHVDGICGERLNVVFDKLDWLIPWTTNANSFEAPCVSKGAGAQHDLSGTRSEVAGLGVSRIATVDASCQLEAEELGLSICDDDCKRLCWAAR